MAHLDIMKLLDDSKLQQIRAFAAQQDPNESWFDDPDRRNIGIGSFLKYFEQNDIKVPELPVTEDEKLGQETKVEISQVEETQTEGEPIKTGEPVDEGTVTNVILIVDSGTAQEWAARLAPLVQGDVAINQPDPFLQLAIYDHDSCRSAKAKNFVVVLDGERPLPDNIAPAAYFGTHEETDILEYIDSILESSGDEGSGGTF